MRIKIIALLLLLITSISAYALTSQPLERLFLMADDDEGTFLGSFEDKFSSASIFNEFGNYGSRFSSSRDKLRDLYFPPEGRCWALSQDTFNSLVADNRIWFGKDGDSRPRQKRFISEMEGQSAWSWWPNDEVGHNQEAKKENIKLFGQENAFDTPKPERLIERILTLATNPGDLVLDSFLGSGTTAAVAHKMGRHYIGIEIGDHAYTHCKVRLSRPRYTQKTITE